jgi:hypothetical protein
VVVSKRISHRILSGKPPKYKRQVASSKHRFKDNIKIDTFSWTIFVDLRIETILVPMKMMMNLLAT